jgi:hypothetical protein
MQIIKSKYPYLQNHWELSPRSHDISDSDWRQEGIPQAKTWSRGTSYTLDNNMHEAPFLFHFYLNRNYT